MDADFSNEPLWMKITAVTLSILFFVSFLAVEIIALKRINFKVERSGFILLAAYSITIC
jgi:hypothetical protein